MYCSSVCGWWDNSQNTNKSSHGWSKATARLLKGSVAWVKHTTCCTVHVSDLRHLTLAYCFQWKLLLISCFNISFLSFLLQNLTITVWYDGFKGLSSKTLKTILPLLLERVPKTLFSTDFLRSPFLQVLHVCNPLSPLSWVILFLYWSTWIFSVILPAAPTDSQVLHYSSVWDDKVSFA